MKKTNSRSITMLPLNSIQAGNFNPRKQFPENELQELAESIKQQGVIQPIVVRPQEDVYEIVCGERRYRAAIIAGLETIPSIVKELSDDVALETAITENLQRRDISPMEEAIAYRKLVETNRYEVQALALRFGKSEQYIRNRMRLNDLIEEITSLLDHEVITMAIALELCKYSEDIQRDVYENHLMEEGYNSWANLRSKDFITRMERTYCNDLDNYFFDKSACAHCPFNTNNFNLFPTDGTEGKCSNPSCLTEKNKTFLVESVKSLMEKDPELDIFQPPYDNDDTGIISELMEQGYMVYENYPTSFPEKPEEVQRDDYESDEDFEEAVNDYSNELDEFKAQSEELENLYSEGKIKKLVRIQNNHPELCYVTISNNEEEIVNDDTGMLEKLEKQDKRYQEIAVEKTVEDAKQLVRKAEINQVPFTPLEEELLYFILLSSLKKEHFAQLGMEEKYYLTDEDKTQLSKSLSEEQKTLIRRDFMVSNLADAYGKTAKSSLLLEFTRLHFPEEVNVIESKYNEIYQKRHDRIEEKKKVLEMETVV